jgi:hypothetical protein
MNNPQTPYNLTLRTDSLFTLEQFFRAVKNCGQSDWEDCSIIASVTLTPATTESHNALALLLEKERSLGIAGLAFECNPKL